jgi:hypothetical protein
LSIAHHRDDANADDRCRHHINDIDTATIDIATGNITYSIRWHWDNVAIIDDAINDND